TPRSLLLWLVSLVAFGAACTPSGSGSNAGAAASTTTPTSLPSEAPSAAPAATEGAGGGAGGTAGGAAAEDGGAAEAKTVPDIEYVPTPNNVVEKMLEVSKIGKDDVLYDLGCGDG